ncbi:DUF1659 domain-containing protein [Pectinatus cerevisiiphilus]|uniref:Uncharacterized protein DUF1659 n=1 Tax=Pectinatus cerevisiiphilus TaxID=86956 RepID=A0A4R3K2M7_9FIRM|nr:DUF1659 domain-containing protein [Pectinatus cerevisiiphilus]TCS76700.1 uncharacterized protein DUF1659 [Pectinatus cerevisiiphilus]
MATVKKDLSTSLIIKVENGITESGKTKYAQRSFSAINPAVSDDNLLNAGTAIGALQAHTLGTVVRQDTCTLSQE